MFSLKLLTLSSAVIIICNQCQNLEATDESNFPFDGAFQPTTTQICRNGTWKCCGDQISVGFVVGGKPADPGVYPFMALFGYYNQKVRQWQYKCSGTLINRRYVVTAAHCHRKRGRPVDKVAQVVLGDFKIDSDQNARDCFKKGAVPAVCSEENPYCLSCDEDVIATNASLRCGGTCGAMPQRILINRKQQRDHIITHPEFKPKDYKKGNDIALVRLPEPAKLMGDGDDTAYQYTVWPACLPWNGPAPDGQLFVAGYGKTTQDREDNGDFRSLGAYSGVLNELELTGLKKTTEQCQAIAEYSGVTEKQMCVGGEQGKDSCNGDSGSPLVAFTPSKSNDESVSYVIGLVSYGSTKCGVGLPAVYTKISSYIDWIVENMKP